MAGVESYLRLAGEAVAGVKAALDVVKGAAELFKRGGRGNDTETERALQEAQARLSDLFDRSLHLQEAMLSLYEKNQAVVTENDKLRRQIGEFDRFQRESGGYRLKTLAKQTVAMVPENADAEAGDAHYACAQCFQERHIAFLQFDHTEFYFDRYSCPRCGHRVCVPNESRPTVHVVPRRSKWDDV